MGVGGMGGGGRRVGAGGGGEGSQSDLTERCVWGRHQGASVSGLGDGIDGIQDQSGEQEQETGTAWVEMGVGGGGYGCGAQRFAGLEGPRSSQWRGSCNSIQGLGPPVAGDPQTV